MYKIEYRRDGQNYQRYVQDYSVMLNTIQEMLREGIILYNANSVKVQICHQNNVLEFAMLSTDSVLSIPSRFRKIYLHGINGNKIEYLIRIVYNGDTLNQLRY